MTAQEALAQIKAGVRPGYRGIGCNAIIAPDGTTWHAVSEQSYLVRTYDLADCIYVFSDVRDMPGEYRLTGWTCDTDGQIYI